MVVPSGTPTTNEHHLTTSGRNHNLIQSKRASLEYDQIAFTGYYRVQRSQDAPFTSRAIVIYALKMARSGPHCVLQECQTRCKSSPQTLVELSLLTIQLGRVKDVMSVLPFEAALTHGGGGSVACQWCWYSWRKLNRALRVRALNSCDEFSNNSKWGNSRLESLHKADGRKFTFQVPFYPKPEVSYDHIIRVLSFRHLRRITPHSAHPQSLILACLLLANLTNN